jgi:hypothetical protein
MCKYQNIVVYLHYTTSVRKNKDMTTQEFTELCRRHDWTFEYSDSHSVWERGMHRRRVLLNAIANAETPEQKEKLSSIYNQYNTLRK